MQFDSNVQGRYSLHLHRTGTEQLDAPAIVVGNSVYDAPGWGFVHHDSNAILENNASFDTFGAGYVAETGNETGSWNDNIAIYATGINWAQPKVSVRLSDSQFDTAVGGDGFWFQGRMVTAEDNIASSVNHGFVYFHRDGDNRMIDPPYDSFFYNEALMRTKVSADDIPILGFSGNETFAAREGLHVVKSNPNQGHDVWTHLDDFTAWNVQSGVHLQYTAHYLLTNFDLIAKETEQFAKPKDGISFGSNTFGIVIVDPSIDGFKSGINLHKEWRGGLTGTPEEQNKYTVINPTFENNQQDLVNYDQLIDTLLIDKPELPIGFGLELEPLTFGNLSESWNTIITGTKTDSLGTSSFSTDFDPKVLNGVYVAELLEDLGYWSTSSGQNYTLVNIYFTDSASGQIYFETHPVFINEDVPLGIENKAGGYFANSVYNGIQELEDIYGTKYAGSIALDVPQLAEDFFPISLPIDVPDEGKVMSFDFESFSALLFSGDDHFKFNDLRVIENSSLGGDSLAKTYGKGKFSVEALGDNFDFKGFKVRTADPLDTTVITVSGLREGNVVAIETFETLQDQSITVNLGSDFEGIDGFEIDGATKLFVDDFEFWL